jgi:hypothetical protein
MKRRALGALCPKNIRRGERKEACPNTQMQDSAAVELVPSFGKSWLCQLIETCFGREAGWAKAVGCPLLVLSVGSLCPLSCWRSE